MNIEKLQFTIAAGETKRFERAGRYIELLDASSSVSLFFSDENGGRVGDARNVDSGIYVKGGFSAFEIFSAAAQTVTLLITTGEGGSRRQPGIVRVVDGEREKVIAGVCFRGVANVAGGGGGGTAGQVWNPAGSGKNVFVQAIRLGSNAADSWSLFTTSVALPAPAALQGVNLDRSGPAAVALVRAGTSADPLGATASMASGYVAASADIVILLPRPVLLRPGLGCMVYLNTPANNLRAVFEWEEWPV